MGSLRGSVRGAGHGRRGLRGFTPSFSTWVRAWPQGTPRFSTWFHSVVQYVVQRMDACPRARMPQTDATTRQSCAFERSGLLRSSARYAYETRFSESKARHHLISRRRPRAHSAKSYRLNSQSLGGHQLAVNVQGRRARSSDPLRAISECHFAPKSRRRGSKGGHLPGHF